VTELEEWNEILPVAEIARDSIIEPVVGYPLALRNAYGGISNQAHRLELRVDIFRRIPRFENETHHCAASDADFPTDIHAPKFVVQGVE